MSQWRREASRRLPELQQVIASAEVDNPMMLWIELNLTFEKLCDQIPPPIDLIVRIWQYCGWCLKHPNEDVQTAAALGFAEHLLDSPARAAVLPKLMSRSDFLGFRKLLERQHSSSEVDRCAQTLWR